VQVLTDVASYLAEDGGTLSFINPCGGLLMKLFEVKKESGSKSPEAMSAAEAARYLGVSYITLHNWRKKGYGPVYYWAGGLIKYRKSDIDLWIEEQVKQRTLWAVQEGADVQL
jgi:hypothetical protein